MQEKLEKSWTLLLFSAKQSKNRSEKKLDCAIGLKNEDPTQLQFFLMIKEIKKKKFGCL